MSAHLVFVHGLSPLHAGTGQGIGVIDLPIAREKATNIPLLPGSSLKGALRDVCQQQIPSVVEALFGRAEDVDTGHSGSIIFSDVRLLLLPVRSLYGTFAWVSAPYVLNRLARDATSAGQTDIPPACPALAAYDHCLPGSGQSVLGKSMVYLEDLDLTPYQDNAVIAWATWLARHIFPGDSRWQQELEQRLCIVHDDVFGFLLETATEITARIKLDDATKTVADGQLWYEEALPAESILAGIALIAPPDYVRRRTELTAAAIRSHLDSLTIGALQLGGKATIGRGLCRVRLTEAVE